MAAEDLSDEPLGAGYPYARRDPDDDDGAVVRNVAQANMIVQQEDDYGPEEELDDTLALLLLADDADPTENRKRLPFIRGALAGEAAIRAGHVDRVMSEDPAEYEWVDDDDGANYGDDAA